MFAEAKGHVCKDGCSIQRGRFCVGEGRVASGKGTSRHFPLPQRARKRESVLGAGGALTAWRGGRFLDLARRHAALELQVATLAAQVARLVAVGALGHRVRGRAARVALRRLGAGAGEVTNQPAVVAGLGTTSTAVGCVARAAAAAAALGLTAAAAALGLAVLLDLRIAGGRRSVLRGGRGGWLARRIEVGG